MKNFARLLRFAWPYRVRFALSLGCAMMVALFWGGNIGAVYPLLQILIRSESCQSWVAEQIETTRTERDALAGRIEELRAIGDVGVGIEAKQARVVRATAGYDAAYEAVKSLRLAQQAEAGFAPDLGEAGAKPGLTAELAAKKTLDGPKDQALRVAKARADEAKFAYDLAKAGRFAELDWRLGRLERDLTKASWWNYAYLKVQPFANRYLPGNSFRTLVLLLSVVMVGIALKGFFLFIQEVLVSDLAQLTLFDIRNLFYRRTMALDLASFNDQGSAELLARFTNDMDSLHQGLMTILGRVVREPLRIVSCLGAALWLNWRLTCLALILVPVSGVLHPSSR